MNESGSNQHLPVIMSLEENDETDRIARASASFLSTKMEQESQQPRTTEASSDVGPSVNLVPISPPGYSPDEKPKAHEPSPAVRPSTPPPLKGMHDDASFNKKYGGEGSPRSPSGLTWRRAGSAHNLYPNQLIGDRGQNPSRHFENLPRLVDRGLAFHQSPNKVHLRHNQGWNIYRLLRFNWFHVMLRWPSKYSFTFLVTAWTGQILFFALLYVWNDEVHRGGRCVLGGANGEVIGWAGAFAFSLQTCNTVGKDILEIGCRIFFRSMSCLMIVVVPHRVYLAEWSQFILRKGLFELADYYLCTDGCLYVLQRFFYHVRLQSTWKK